MAPSIPVLLPSPRSPVRALPLQRPDRNPETPHIDHVPPFTYAFMMADTTDSFPRSHIDLTMDRQTRRRLRKSAGRSGGVFQVAQDATSPWDLEYVNQYAFDDHFFLQREAQPFSFFDDSRNNGQHYEADTMLSTSQRRVNNADTTHKDHPDNDDHDSSVELPAQESAPNSSNTEMEESTLLSALLPRLNLRKVSGQSTPNTHLERRALITPVRQKGALFRSEQVSNPMQTSQPSTAQLRFNMDSLAKYIEEKLAAIRGTRSKGKPAPGFLTIHPQLSGIGTLQTQYRSQGVYNNKRAGMSQFFLDDQTALQKVTDFNKQAEPHTALEEQRPTQQSKAKAKVSKFRELVNSTDAKEYEELPTLADVRISEVSTLHLPEPALDIHQQSTSQALASESRKFPTGVPKRKPLPERALDYSSSRAPPPDTHQPPASSPQLPQARRQSTTSYLNRSLPSLPPPPAAPRKSDFPPELKDPTTTDPQPPSPPPAPPKPDLTPEQRYQYLRQQIEALSETDGRPVHRLWNCLLRDLPDAEERNTLYLQHRAHALGTTADHTAGSGSGSGSNDVLQDDDHWEACDHEEEWRATKREGALKALEGREK